MVIIKTHLVRRNHFSVPHDEYPHLKNKTWKGSKVRKLIKRLKQMQKVLKQSPREILFFFETPHEKADNHGKHTALKRIRTFARELFSMNDIKNSYDKAIFDRKSFSGARIVTLLEFLDLSTKTIEIEINDLDDMVDDESKIDYLSTYLRSQIKTFQVVKNLIIDSDFLNKYDDD